MMRTRLRHYKVRDIDKGTLLRVPFRALTTVTGCSRLAPIGGRKKGVHIFSVDCLIDLKDARIPKMAFGSSSHATSRLGKL